MLWTWFSPSRSFTAQNLVLAQADRGNAPTRNPGSPEALPFQRGLTVPGPQSACKGSGFGVESVSAVAVGRDGRERTGAAGLS
jgi:hypothetical protein